MSDELGGLLVEHALLEGDFVLRSGKRSPYYLDKYRFETRPELLGPLGERIADAARACEPDAHRLAAPAVGAIALAAAASLASGLPFIIVRDEAKGYGTGNRLEGTFAAGDLVLLVEDVVTSGGALAEAVGALRGPAARRSRRAQRRLRRRPGRGRFRRPGPYRRPAAAALQSGRAARRA